MSDGLQGQAPESVEPVEEVSEKSAGAQRVAAVLIVCALLALPVAYLFLHRAGSGTVMAGAPAVALAPDLGVLELAAKNSPSPANRLNLSLAYINAGQAGRAIPVLSGLVAEDPKNVLAWNNLCVAHTILQDYASGIDECGKAIALQPDYKLAQNNLKWALGERQKVVKTLSEEEQVDNGRRDATFYNTEGLNFLHIGDEDQAIKAWGRALEIDPKNAIAANNIGLAKMLKKQPAAAIPYFEKAAALDPTMQIAKNNLAWAMQEQAKK